MLFIYTYIYFKGSRISSTSQPSTWIFGACICVKFYSYLHKIIAGVLLKGQSWLYAFGRALLRIHTYTFRYEELTTKISAFHSSWWVFYPSEERKKSCVENSQRSVTNTCLSCRWMTFFSSSTVHCTSLYRFSYKNILFSLLQQSLMLLNQFFSLFLETQQKIEVNFRVLKCIFLHGNFTK